MYVYTSKKQRFKYLISYNISGVKMASYTDFLVGFGSFITGGFLTVLSGISGISVSFGSLPVVLYAFGGMMVGAGVIDRFVLKYLKSKAAADEKAEAAEAEKA